MPLRSRLGNLATKYAFWGLVGKKLDDTQSGLRGIPRQLARQLLRLKNSGYEFELDMLVHCRQSGVPIVACPIATVYLDDNRSSHFHPILDSLQDLRRLPAIHRRLAGHRGGRLLRLPAGLRPAASLLTAQASARLAAIGVNFVLARQAVFRSRNRVVWALAKFILLVVVMGATSYCLIRAAMYAFGWNVIAAKMASELLALPGQFRHPAGFIFGDARRRPGHGRGAGAHGPYRIEDGRGIMRRFHARTLNRSPLSRKGRGEANGPKAPTKTDFPMLRWRILMAVLDRRDASGPGLAGRAVGRAGPLAGAGGRRLHGDRHRGGELPWPDGPAWRRRAAIVHVGQPPACVGPLGVVDPQHCPIAGGWRPSGGGGRLGGRHALAVDLWRPP